MANPVVTIQQFVQSRLPGGALPQDGSVGSSVVDPTGASKVSNIFNGLQAAAVEGSLYSWSQEGTRDTGVNFSIATGTTYAATQALLVVYNGNTQGKNVILDSFTICYDAVNTAGVRWQWYFAIDNGNRYSSGGALMAGFNAYGESPAGVLAYTGAITATGALGNVRDLGKITAMNGIGAATPTINITTKFGCQETPMGTQAIAATTAQNVVLYGPPVVIVPGNSFVINEFQTSRSASGTGEFFLTAIVR